MVFRSHHSDSVAELDGKFFHHCNFGVKCSEIKTVDRTYRMRNMCGSTEVRCATCASC